MMARVMTKPGKANFFNVASTVMSAAPGRNIHLALRLTF